MAKKIASISTIMLRTDGLIILKKFWDLLAVADFFVTFFVTDDRVI